MRIKAKEIAQELGLSKQEKELKNFETQENSIQGEVMMLNYVKNGIIMKRSQDRHPAMPLS